VVSIVFTLALMRASRVSWRTPVLDMHLWRTVVGTLSLGAWFYAITYLPLATAMTLNYMSSIWMAVFIVGGALLYGQSLRQGPLVLTVIAAFVGVVMLLRPTLADQQWFAGLVGLLSGIGAALAYMQVTALARVGEPASRTVFYFALGTAVAGAAGMVVMGITPWEQVSTTAALWLVPIGVLASVGQWCMTRAYSQGATLVAANWQYSGIVFAALFGMLLFGDVITPLGWAGMALIIASGIAATLLRARALPEAPESAAESK
jgi:S-adenosylmethionine uptake transporter